MSDKKIGLLYVGLHRQLVKKFGVGATITRKDFIVKVGRHYIMPKELRPLILREMVDKKLIERIDRDHLKILPLDESTINSREDLLNLYGIEV